jgi:hypothetical protein
MAERVFSDADREGRTGKAREMILPRYRSGKLFSRWDREMTMSTWSNSELRKIGNADDLHVAPLRDDGVTYGTPTWIWSVALEDTLYARAYNGKNSRWYQAAMRQKAGRINVAGMSKEVTFEPVRGPINDRIDDAYRKKYQASPYLAAMIGVQARAATVKVMPRDE